MNYPYIEHKPDPTEGQRVTAVIGGPDGGTAGKIGCHFNEGKFVDFAGKEHTNVINWWNRQPYEDETGCSGSPGELPS